MRADHVLPLAVVVLLGAAPAVARAQFPPEVRGRVTAADGRPLAGARVEADGGTARAVTGADGGFVLRGLEPGARELRATLLGHRPATTRILLENGVVARVVLALAPLPVALDPVHVDAERRAADAAAAGALVIERAEIERAGAAELGALLDGRAGLTVVRRGGPGAPATLSVRGSSADQLLVLVDGAELNEPLSGDADLSTVPLAVVERVTVLRGAQAARWGARALAGVVLVETRRAGRRELALRADAGGLGERAAGVTAGGSRELGGATAGVLVSAERRDVTGDFAYELPAVRGGGRDVRRNADASSRTALATASVARGGAEARLRTDLLDVERGMPGSYVQPSAGARQEQRRTGAALGLRLARGRMEWTADATAQSQRARFHDSAPPFGPAYDDAVRVRALVGAASGTALLDAAALSAGVELREQRFTASAAAPGAPDRQRQAGGWASARLWRDVGATRPLRVELAGAVRADRASLLDGTELSPRVTASAGTPAVTARLSWGHAFSPPSLGDQFFQEGVQVRPNPALAPERVRHELEAGLAVRERRLGPARVDVDVAAYRADVRGMILWFPDFRFVWSPVNHDVRRRGAEVDARARFAWRAFDVHAAASAVRVDYDGPVLTGQVAYRPAVTAAGGVALDVAGARLALDARHVGRRRTARGTALNALDPFTVADLRVARPFAVGAWRATVATGVENLLDEQADLLADYPRAGRRWTAGLRLDLEDRDRSTSNASLRSGRSVRR